MQIDCCENWPPARRESRSDERRKAICQIRDSHRRPRLRSRRTRRGANAGELLSRIHKPGRRSRDRIRRFSFHLDGRLRLSSARRSPGSRRSRRQGSRIVDTLEASAFRIVRYEYDSRLRHCRRKASQSRNYLSDQDRKGFFMRKKVIAANWKMYKTPDQSRDFFRDFLPLVSGHDRDEIVVCPPFVDLHVAVDAAKGSNVAVGAQDVHWEKEGAYTGEISTGMLLAAGATHVIVGHSERRQYFGETDDVVNLKLKAALEAGLTPI